MVATRYYYQITATNAYLGKQKVLKAQSKYELQLKYEEQSRKWTVEESRQRQREQIADLKEQANDMTEAAVAEIEAYKTILQATLAVDDKLDWGMLYERKPFPKLPPRKVVPSKDVLIKKLNVPKESFWEVISKSRKNKRITLEQLADAQYQELIKEVDKKHSEALMQYEQEKSKFKAEQDQFNAEIDQFRADFEGGHGEAIERYVRMVLGRSVYPDSFMNDYEVSYEPISGSVIVNYTLPHPDQMPQIVEYRFVATRKEIVEKEMKKRDFEAFYEDFIYQLTLRTIHEVFESVYIESVKAVVFNGWVHGIDGATGNLFTSCNISCQAERDAFESFNLSLVNPKECVRSLKGLFAGPLYKVAPVRPILDINRNDSRFVESQDVLDAMDASTNLAEMDWEAFEHLVRQLFGKIFSSDDAAVKVTQASRDGGVDAIAFDPDPIRGGKFVIQAKRYNNVVPVSAVRDLYGTMISEGAAKGILVTTSYYGSDSREFVKDKPISLVDGSNLVYMLQEYGYDVTIRLKSK